MIGWNRRCSVSVPTFIIAIDGPAGAGKGTLARGSPTTTTSTISTPA